MQNVTDGANGQANFSFTANVTLSNVTLIYQVNGGTTADSSLTLGNGLWNGTIKGLKANDIITYKFTYTYSSKTYTSSQYTHTYSGQAGTSTGYYQIPQQLANGQLQLNFIPMSTATSVSASYSINSGASKTATLTNSNGSWSTVISGLANGDKIVYTFSYTIGGQQYTSSQENYQYVGCGTVVTNPNYTSQIQQLGNGSAYFTFTPVTSTNYVAIHYVVNTQSQQSLVMNKPTGSSTTWNYTLKNLKNGDKITYYFTYHNSSGLSVDTTKSTFTYTAG
ncbi:hypothetical protein BN1013_00136 [Candidatus Rubidus massiliensis]|nr:hypothetical protein BN1013_00136 [Candidatus Rubidus massiliensis]